MRISDWSSDVCSSDLYAATFFGYFGLAMPNFLFALILMHYLNIWFGLSIGGLMDPQYIGAPWSVDKAISVFEHLLIPMFVIGTAGTAAMIRRLRANMLDEMQDRKSTRLTSSH